MQLKHLTGMTGKIGKTGKTGKGLSEEGFSLIEILVVLVIIGILAVSVGPKIMSRPDEARITKTKMLIESLESALKMYRLDNGSYPTTEQGLQALIAAPETGTLAKNWREGGYMEKGKIPQDPWKNDFIYICPGVHSDFDLSSYGPDGEAGGDGKNADINNWELE